MKLLTILIFMISAQAQNKKSPLCVEKKIQYGEKFISCNAVDWGVQPLSADYQPGNSSPMTARPEQIKDFKNDYPGIKNTKFYIDENQLPLASKFISAVDLDSKSKKEDESLVNWLSNDWYKNQQPTTDSLGWEGKCGAWASWSMDPQLQTLFSNIRDGILCNGIPFSRGELKEIVTALYPESLTDSKEFSNYFAGYAGMDSDELEDANVALSKLGLFGAGEFSPDDVLTFAQNAKKQNLNLMMDRDPGGEIWNQPIKNITDVAYLDSRADELNSLTSAEYSVVLNQANHKLFLSRMKKIELELTRNLLEAEGVNPKKLCELRKMVNLKCDEANLSKSLSAQVTMLKEVKAVALQKNLIKVKSGISIIQHEMIIEYGDENKFASSNPDHNKTESYIYRLVKTGKTSRSEWAPRAHRLSEICSNPALADARNSTSMTREFKINEKCTNGKPTNPAQANQEYFTGAVPPESFKTFEAKPDFFAHKPEQKKAYDKLLLFLSTC